MMRTASKSLIFLLACAMSFGVSQSARAETTTPPAYRSPGERDRGHGEGDPVAMLNAAMSLTADQQARVKAIFEAARADAKVLLDDKTLSQDDRMAKMKDLHEGALAKVKGLLTPDQQKKFDEVQAQLPHGPGMPHHGPGPMGDPVAMLATALNLTADQQTQVKVIFDAVHPRMEAVEGDTTSSQDDKMARMKELRDTTHAKIRALLTDDQAQKFDELLNQLHGSQHD